MRMRPAIYAAVSLASSGRSSQRSATRCFSCRSDGSFSRSASSGWPASTSGSSFSVFVSMFASSRISSSSSSGRLCASSMTSAVDHAALRGARAARARARSAASSSTRRPRRRARTPCARNSKNSARVSVGLFRYDARARSRSACESSAARISVVLPVPASPISSVRPCAPRCRTAGCSAPRGARRQEQEPRVRGQVERPLAKAVEFLVHTACLSAPDEPDAGHGRDRQRQRAPRSPTAMTRRRWRCRRSARVTIIGIDRQHRQRQRPSRRRRS